MTNGILIKTDGTVEVFTKSIELENVQAAVDAEVIEHVTLDQSISAYVDGEGLLKELVPNEVASFAMSMLGFPIETYPTGSINGNVLFIGAPDEEGNDLPLTNDQEKVVRILANG